MGTRQVTVQMTSPDRARGALPIKRQTRLAKGTGTTRYQPTAPPGPSGVASSSGRTTVRVQAFSVPRKIITIRHRSAPSTSRYYEPRNQGSQGTNGPRWGESKTAGLDAFSLLRGLCGVWWVAAHSPGPGRPSLNEFYPSHLRPTCGVIVS